MLIAGPTASGKSAIALRLAEIAGGVVINADSAQVYADLRILTARPTVEEEARVPHRLYGHIDGGVACSAPLWAADAKAAIQHAQGLGRLPILVGGTGLYLRTLLDGIAPIPPIPEAIRAEVRALPVAAAHRLLAEVDADAAVRLRPSDTTRVARALEVIRGTGRTLAQWQTERVGGIAGEVRVVPLILSPPRDWLRARCDARLETMLGNGADEEVAALLARGLDPALPVMRAIGVSELSDWMAGRIDRATATGRAQAATRQYAKRQQTWFSRQFPHTWPRSHLQLDNDSVDEYATKLRTEALTA
ncbi:MAG: miaA [Sphingomonas bacterium]|nr:miaA [Sphingomonas bacterium]